MIRGTFTLLREPRGEDVKRPLTLRHRIGLIFALLTHRHVVHW